MPDWLEDDAVWGELVSYQNSLISREKTGNFAKSGPQVPDLRKKTETLRGVEGKFPVR
jgi:hypothetical protein